ncbi:uncharacterized protein LOC102807089 [Saccoglossus kowalevskii]|uniref:Uncharacterized protein LOC102807089 n=1 Tax=Saccoglossus kowalevskii TaxID=10224 RepID=A0ABM0LYQ1_SACKO|nr:PREDICTED: uncharacterized protein LOC102807089 [Saccoglossus kowalevskii]
MSARGTRPAYRGKMTQLLKKAEDTIVKFNSEDDVDWDNLLITKERIEDKFKLLEKLDAEIIQSTNEDQLNDVILEADNYMDEVFARKFKICKFINQHAATRETTGSTVRTNTSSTRQSTTSTSNTVHLPKLQLPTFSGDSLKWKAFYDVFISAVDNDPSFSEVQKFQYLRGQLSGEAARTIDGLPLTNTNYRHAIQLLEKRYGQTHKIVNAYMKSLWDLPKPTSDMNSLRNFYDTIETNVRGLEALGKKETSYGDLLVPIVFEKLPRGIRKQITRDHGDCEWKLSELRESLYKEIQALEVSSLINDSAGEYEQETQQMTAAFYTGTKTSATRTSTRNFRPRNAPKPRKTCAYCKGQHFHSNCVIVTDRNKRHDIVKRDRLCFNCLGRHQVSECRSTNKCLRCGRKHHTSLCTLEPQMRASSDQSSRDTTSTSLNKSTPACVNFAAAAQRKNNYDNQPVLLKTVVTEISTDTQSLTAVLLFDEGATRTFITEDLAQKLNVKPSGSELIQLATLNGSRSVSALIVPTISTPMKNLISKSVLNLPHLRGLRLAHPASSSDSFEVSLLIGADYYWNFVGDDIIRGPGPTAVMSEFGYLLSGPTGTRMRIPTNTTMLHIAASNQNEQIKLQDFWNLESIGIRDEIHEPKADFFKEYCDSNLQFEEGKYTAKFPWKPEHPPLPTNYQLSEKRTRNLVHRLPSDILEYYNKTIHDQISRDFVEEVLNDDNERGHYLPHHAVKKDSPTTPIRVVYDCSSKQSPIIPSLNDCLEVGPQLLNDLTGILLRFRVHRYAFSSDIEKAFLNVRLHESDRDYTKFLWLTDPTNPDSAFKTYRFKSVPFGAASSPFILNAVLKTHTEKNATNAITSDLKHNIYVDNIISGTSEIKDVIEYYEFSKDLLKSGGFNLRSWASNCEQLRDLAKADNVADLNTEVHILGLRWKTLSDELTYANNISNDETILPTKREVSSATSSVYDPFGYLAPVVIKAKIFTQELWKRKLDWDEPLPSDLTNEWNAICSLVNQQIPSKSVTLFSTIMTTRSDCIGIWQKLRD